METTDDAVLGGRLILRQPKRGHRIGHDAILLAAATDARAGEHAVDLGAGIGGAGLALAARVQGVSVTLVEIDPSLTQLCSENIVANGFGDRARAVSLDATAPAEAFAAADIHAASIDRVLMNPPFNDPARQRPSPDPQRRRAHVMEGEGLQSWVAGAHRLLKPEGGLTLIWRADALGEVLDVLSSSFGTIEIIPVYPKPHSSAIRILVRAVKAGRTPLVINPPLILAGDDGRPSEAAEALLRRGEHLSWI
ncbi:MAG TPA: methyltransferase [Xanthobacteraceae bacterium]|nr:methyltransferase [Xanthobacteraceae bacterium]